MLRSVDYKYANPEVTIDCQMPSTCCLTQQRRLFTTALLLDIAPQPCVHFYLLFCNNYCRKSFMTPFPSFSQKRLRIRCLLSSPFDYFEVNRLKVANNSIDAADSTTHGQQDPPLGFIYVAVLDREIGLCALSRHQ